VIPKRIGRVLGLAAALLVFELSATAQDVPLVNIFVGGSYAGSLEPDHDDSIESGLGPEGEINFNFHKRLGVFYGYTFRHGRQPDENLAGVRYSIKRTDFLSFFAHAKAGGASGKAVGFVFGGGGGLDLSLVDWMGVRLFNLDIISTARLGYIRASGGLVFNLGKR
jgi:hypothetical protein